MKSKLLKKVVPILLSVMLVNLSNGYVYAATENVNVSTTIPAFENGGISTYSGSRPQNFVNLTYMTFSGAAEETSLYLNKGFTGVRSAKVVVSNYHSSTLTVKVRKNAILFPVVETHTIVGNDYNGSFIISGLNPNSKYYLEFCAPCDFSGSISNND